MTAQVPLITKIKCLRRELALRKNVYAKHVAQGRMQQTESDYEIEVLEAILADYLLQERDRKQRAPADADAGQQFADRR